jgi:FAD:protein FMN transferase
MKPKTNTLSLEATGTVWKIEYKSTKSFDKKITTCIGEFEKAYSRFLSTSLLSRLNTDKLLASPPDEFMQMLEYAKAMYIFTDGVFNISVGGELVAMGYGQSTGQQVMSDMNLLEVSNSYVSMPADMYLDFGGFGKGWLIDKIGRLLADNGCKNYVINGGGDILVGSDGEEETLALEHPNDPSLYIGVVKLQNGALAVSSNKKRTWQHAGKTHSHIVDTSVTKVAREVASVYITAKTALIADTLATVLLIDPSQEKHLCDKYSANAYIVYDDMLLATD